MTDHNTAHPSGAMPGATLSALFDSRSDAEDAVTQLRGIGLSDGNIRLTGDGALAGSAPREDKGFLESLSDFFMPDEDRHTYAEGLSRGGYLVTATDVPPDLQESALDVLDADGTINIDEREETWRADGWTGYAGAPEATTAPSGMAESRADFGAREDMLSDGETVEVVEEHLRVGKRDTSHGRVRVRSYVRETPVSEQIDLTDERVEIERHAVDRPVAAGDDAFRERSIEAEGRSEEAVVSKEARVVEEIGLRRERETHSETVSDTVRNTEVEIDDDRVDPDLDATRR